MSDLLTEDLEFPRRDDSLFNAKGGHWIANACLNFTHDQSWGYVNGYKTAGDLLVQYACTGREQDVLVYPICFNYRHYIELALKQIIRDANNLTDSNSDYPHGHDLQKLWVECRPLLEEVFKESPIEPMGDVERLIAEFAQMDPTGMSFRYWEDRGGNASLPTVRHINLEKLGETMQRLSNFFDCCQTGISVNLDHKQEMEAEYRQYQDYNF